MNATEQPVDSEVMTHGSTDAQRWWVAPLITVAAMTGCVVGSLGIYHQYFAPRPVKFALLDLHYIIDAKEIEFTSMLASPSVTEDERKKAMDLVSGIEPELKKVLAQVRVDCGCEILVKAAALTSSNIPDITKHVADLMKINADEIIKAKERIRQNINGSQLK
jgi:hypothetical protein